MSKSKARSYIAFDGEGETRHVANCKRDYECRCPHFYCLLVWAVRTGPDSFTHGYIYNPDGLGTYEALDFIWQNARAHRKQTPVIFSASYDFNCLLKGLDRRRAQWLWDEMPVSIGDIKVEYNKRSLTLRRYRSQVVLSDVWRFYQGRFVTALEKNLPDHPALEEIRAQKERRSIFNFATEFETILHYCVMELCALIELMERLDADLKEAGIGRTALYGAGSIAAKMLHQHHIRQHNPIIHLESPNRKGKRIWKPSPEMVSAYREIWPEHIEQAAYFAYSGGRIEPWKFGLHKGDFYVYDLRSAYPSAMRDLPSLSAGRWERNLDFRNARSFSVYKVRFETNTHARGYPFFQRIENGGILYPSVVEGWYWQPELEAAFQCGFDFQVSEGWEWIPTDSTRPFQFVGELYEFRALLKLAGKIGAQEVIKLGLNSLYGKLAQTVGGTELNPPAYHQIGWAGYVTAKTRAEVFKVAMQQPNATVFIATDGVASTQPLNVNTGNGLGEWEVAKYDSSLVVQAGVYFLWSEGKRKDKYRGFDRESIDPDVVLNTWRTGICPCGCKKPDLMHVPSTRFITLGSALEAEKHWDKWCNWRTIKRELDLTGGDGKREFPARWKSGGAPWKHLVNLDPTTLPGIVESVPYVPHWRTLQQEKLDDVLIETYEQEYVDTNGNWETGDFAA